MDTTAHYRKLEHMYLQAPINQSFYSDTRIEVGDGEAVIRFEVGEDYFHALDALHGSVYFKLLDDAAFFAVQSLVRDVFVLTTSFNIDLLRPVTGGSLTAKGTIRFRSRQLFIADASLCDEKGREVALGTGRFAKSRNPLSPDVGYL